MREASVYFSAGANQPGDRGVLVFYCCITNQPKLNALKQLPFSHNSWIDRAPLVHTGL